MVHLASPVSGISPTALADQDPPLGSDGTIVGFGLSDGSSQDYGLKQRGQVVTAACQGDLPDGLLCWDFESPIGPPGTDSNTCNGDSGGPLFVDDGTGRELAGITSGGSSFSCLPTDHSYDTSVATQRPFIDAQGGADLGGGACGSLSQVGDAVTDVVGFTERLDAGKPEGRHSFDVGPDLAELRVALNASEEIGADVDLYVRFGTPPTTTEFDCRAYGSNQWGFCGFPSPAEGTWHVLARRYSGSSTYQITATLFAGEGEEPPPPAVAEKQRRPQRRCLNGLAEAGPGDVSFYGNTKYRRQYEATRASAVLVGSDTQALGVLTAARARGVRVPEDLAIVGYNDIEIAPYLELTTVRVPMCDMGRRGGELLLAQLERALPPVEVTLPAELIVRATSGPCPT